MKFSEDKLIKVRAAAIDFINAVVVAVEHATEGPLVAYTPPEVLIPTPEPVPVDPVVMNTPGIIQPSPIPTPSTMTAPVAPAPVTPAPVSTPQTLPITSAMRDPQEVDNRGIKWDARIHAGSKAIMKNGQWRNKRGVDEALLAQVEQELIAAAIHTAKTEPVIAIVPQTPVVPAAPVVPVITPTPVAPIVPQVEPVVTPVAPDITIPASTKQAHTIDTFKANMMAIIAQLVNEGKITPQYIEQLKEHYKVNELWEMFSDHAKVQTLFDNFCEYNLITKVD